MTPREQKTTQAASFQQRSTAWNAALTAAEQHTILGLTMQGQGMKLMEKGHNAADSTQGAKLVQQAAATVEKGIKIERDARDKMIELYQSEPE